MDQKRPIIVAGAGIAGLTAALFLARNGHEVRVLERASRIYEVGAGLQLSPNATRIIEKLGLMPAVETMASRPEAIVLRQGPDMAELTRAPLGDLAEKRWGAPYLVIHRADLHSVLLTAARREPDIAIETGVTATGFASGPESVAVRVERDGATEAISGRLLVAADGVWSKLRTGFGGAASSRFSGHVAWRTTVSAQGALATALPDLLATTHVTTFMHPDIHVVAYPVQMGRAINLVALMKGEDCGQRWEAAPDPSPFLAAMEKASPLLGRIARGAGDWVAWALHAVPPDGAWSSGRDAVLIGDAAHATTPFAAQGAAMGIEDAAALAAALRLQPTDQAAALTTWERARKARVAKVVKRGAFNHFTWHARGPVRLVRNIVLQSRKPENLLADLDWLYGHDAEVAIPG